MMLKISYPDSATLPLRQRPLRLMDSTTVSIGTERAACTSLRKKTSKSMGTPAALKTCSTAVTSSGPTPSPGISVAVTRSLGATWVSMGLNQRYDQRLPTTPFSCARNILTVHRETLTQYITVNIGGRGESVLLYSVVL